MQKQFDVTLTGLLCNGTETPSPDSTVLLAVSGGVDSMCMAELFLRSLLKPGFALAHCNFHLRGGESDSDESLVQSWGGRYGIKVHTVDFDTAGYAEEYGVSIEMAARELRYRWFGQLCSEYGYDAVAVAHNANDNAETLFLNIARGTGVRGLSGMQEKSPLPYGGEDAPVLVRPMLGFTRNQIEGFAYSHNIEYHTDSTNSDSAYKRNRIRNEIFPLFEKLNPSFVKTVCREIRYFSQVADIAEGYYASSVKNIYSADTTGDDGEPVMIDIKSLTSLEHWEYVLYRFLEQYGFNSASIASVEKFVRNYDGTNVTFSGKVFKSAGYMLLPASDSLLVRRLSDTEDSGSGLSGYGGTIIPGPGTYVFGGHSLVVEYLGRSEVESLKSPKGTVMFDSAKLPFPFFVRGWRQGDWIRPLGMRGRKKVSDLFTDLKYDISRKACSPLVVSSPDDQHILSLIGERVDDSVRIDENTEFITRIML